MIIYADLAEGNEVLGCKEGTPGGPVDVHVQGKVQPGAVECHVGLQSFGRQTAHLWTLPQNHCTGCWMISMETLHIVFVFVCLFVCLFVFVLAVCILLV